MAWCTPKPAGILVAINGTLLGQTPFAKALPPGRHTIELRYGAATRVVPVEISAGVQTEQRISWGNGFNSGQASISSTNRGLKVLIDGRQMGRTPLRQRPPAGQARSDGRGRAGRRQHDADGGGRRDDRAGRTGHAGWASVLSPVQLDILLDGKLVGLDGDSEADAEARQAQPRARGTSRSATAVSVEVRVRPGATTSVSVVPRTPVTVEAPEGTELSINGENMGTLTERRRCKVPLGTAEFVMRYKDEERRHGVPVTSPRP